MQTNEQNNQSPMPRNPANMIPDKPEGSGLLSQKAPGTNQESKQAESVKDNQLKAAQPEAMPTEAIASEQDKPTAETEKNGGADVEEVDLAPAAAKDADSPKEQGDNWEFIEAMKESVGASESRPLATERKKIEEIGSIKAALKKKKPEPLVKAIVRTTAPSLSATSKNKREEVRVKPAEPKKESAEEKKGEPPAEMALPPAETSAPTSHCESDLQQDFAEASVRFAAADKVGNSVMPEQPDLPLADDVARANADTKPEVMMPLPERAKSNEEEEIPLISPGEQRMIAKHDPEPEPQPAEEASPLANIPPAEASVNAAWLALGVHATSEPNKNAANEPVAVPAATDFQWPGETGVYLFYIWHCAQKDESKNQWLAGRFPFLAVKMPLPPKEKLDASLLNKDWAFKRMLYKRDIPLYFHYAEIFQPSFYDPQRILQLKTPYFAYYPAYFVEVMTPQGKAAPDPAGPCLDPENLSYVPLLAETREAQHCLDWLKNKLQSVQGGKTLAARPQPGNVAGLATLQQILRFYLRAYGFLLWCSNYFMNYDNHMRLGYSATGTPVFSNAFVAGMDILDFLGVRTRMPLASSKTVMLGDAALNTADREIIPWFLALGSFKGAPYLADAGDHPWQKQDFVVFDNSPVQDKSRAQKSAENFRLLHQLWKKQWFAPIDQLLAQNKIKIHVRRFSKDSQLPLGINDAAVQDGMPMVKGLYEKTQDIVENDKKGRYLKTYLGGEMAGEFYRFFSSAGAESPVGNVFTREAASDWRLVGYLVHEDELCASAINNRTLIDFFDPDAVPLTDPRQTLPAGILPFMMH